MEKAPYIIFTSGTNLGQLSMTLITIEPARLFLTASAPGRQEIGRYVHELDSGRFEETRRLLEASGYRDLPEPEQVPPGTTFTSFAEGTYGSRPDVIRAFPVGQIPDELDDVIADVDELIEFFLEHPHRVVRGSARVEHEVVTPGEEIPVSIVLTNVGDAPLQIGNPAGALADDRVLLSIVFAGVRQQNGSDDAPSPLSAAGQIDFRVGDVTQVRPDGELEQNPSEVAELEPGEELRLRVAPRVLLEPGEYAASVRYQSLPQQLEGEQTIWGAITMAHSNFRFGYQ